MSVLEREPVTDLVEFYKARLDEDDERARIAGEGRIAWLTYLDGEGQMHYTTVAYGAMTDVWIADGKELPDPARAQVVYDPGRARREVEAKRRVLNAYEAQLAERARIGVLRDAEMAKGDELAPEVAELTGKGIALNGWIQHLGSVVRVHAAAHADHPDYNESWQL